MKTARMAQRRIHWIAYGLVVIAVGIPGTLVARRDLRPGLEAAVTGPSSEYRTSSHKPDEAADEGAVVVEQSKPPTTEHTWRWLWDVDSPDLQLWQTFGRIEGAVMSRWGDLIVSDRGNSHVVRFTTDGELVEIIGRAGAGPGEFGDPMSLEIETEEDILWVTDRTLLRMNRYRLSEQTSEFLDSFPLPVYPSSHPQLLTINDSHSYWASGVAIGSRIVHIDDTGEILKAFGDLFSSTRHSRARRYSAGVVTLSPNGDVLFIATFKPVIERWTSMGELLATIEFPFPETESTKRSERSTPEERGPLLYQVGVAWDEPRSHIFLNIDSVTIYSMLPESIEVVQRHVITDPERWGFPGPFVVSEKGGSIRFFFFDRDGGVRVTRPKEP